MSACHMLCLCSRWTIKKASSIVRKRRSARKRGADAIEEVLSGEADFYYPKESYELNMLQFYLFDVFLFLFVTGFVVLMVPLYLIYCCWKCFRKGGGGSVKVKSN